ncbi:hypothetical protein ASG31_09840 [Chryseobacterium sp. Leaf404]|uniref:hypothetical protein n=1 Tax=unclassified Chryseobacterium TaxID=2593645 RepID=UPI0006FC0BA9|nr:MULTISPECIES: hypothetical protein [unclassified Chryseobacterium]KQT17681.1 hypothetical protein ASG31_09840 [Chryseobacterium sp. Leaf404]
MTITSPFFCDSSEDSYQLNYGISLCDPEKGNYEEAIKFIKTEGLIRKTKNKFYLQSLINFQTKGKKITHEIIDASEYNQKEKEILKLWLFAVTNNDDDYTIVLKDVVGKYKDDFDVKKIELRKILNDRSELIFTVTDFDSLSNSIQKIVQNPKLSKEDKLYFQLLKLDSDYYVYGNEKNLESLRKKIILEYAGLWKKNSLYFSKKYSRLVFKVKCENEKEYFEITDEREPGDDIFDDYREIYFGQPVAGIAGSDNSKYVAFIKRNPLYFGTHEAGFDLTKIDWNKSPKEVETKEQFQEFIRNIDNLIAEFPGAMGPKMIYLDALIKNKKFVYDKDLDFYQTAFLKRIIDVFALNQRADFTNHFDYFRDILQTDLPKIRYREYYKVLFKQVKMKNEIEILDYLQLVRKDFPNNKNLKVIAEEFSKI